MITKEREMLRGHFWNSIHLYQSRKYSEELRIRFYNYWVDYVCSDNHILLNFDIFSKIEEFSQSSKHLTTITPRNKEKTSLSFKDEWGLFAICHIVFFQVYLTTSVLAYLEHGFSVTLMLVIYIIIVIVSLNKKSKRIPRKK